MDKDMAGGQGDGKWTRRWQVDKEMASGQGDGKWTRRWQVDKEVIGLSRVQQFVFHNVLYALIKCLTFLRYMLILCVNIFTQLALTQSVDDSFHLMVNCSSLTHRHGTLLHCGICG